MLAIRYDQGRSRSHRQTSPQSKRRSTDGIYLPLSVYVQRETIAAERQATTKKTLDLIESVISRFPAHDILIAGDFNCHDQLWGGDSISNSQGEAIVQFMHTRGLQLTLPRGTPTHDSGSTIDLSMASSRLFDDLLRCSIWPTEYGSDHRVIESQFDLDLYDSTNEPRRLFRKTNWEKVAKNTKEGIKDLRIPQDKKIPKEKIDEFSTQLTQIVTNAVLQDTPVSRPSAFSKRWWTAELTDLRNAYTRARNEAASTRRAGTPNTRLEATVKVARKTFHDTVRRQRRTCWKEFLGDNNNIWKAAKFLHPAQSSAFGRISVLKTDNGLAKTDQEISEELLSQFFSQTADVPELPQAREGRQHPWEEITKEEVRDAVFRAKPFKAPGPDGLPPVVWQKLWPEVGDHVHVLLQASVRESYLPEQWKVARIVPLRKPGKPDYTLAKAYRPISLLTTLSKALESVFAERLSFLDEKHGILPKAHFGARKQRSTTDALQLVTEQIHQAWKQKKILSLVTFDVKGAFNGVNKGVLCQRLKERGIPPEIVKWVYEFCGKRKASIMVNGTESETIDIAHAGLPQGSPLSPILFLFYNANLVAGKLTDHSGTMAFVDDFTAWVTGPSIKSNIQRIQEKILPPTEKWSQESGALFEPDKTQLIHFTRRRKQDENELLPLVFMGSEISPVSEIKLLGVMIDRKLSFRSHARRAAKRGEIAAMALQRLKGLNPKTARQIFTATVTPTTDYGAQIWFPGSAGTVSATSREPPN